MKNQFWKFAAIFAGLMIIGAGIFFGGKYIVNEVFGKDTKPTESVADRVTLQDAESSEAATEEAETQPVVLTTNPTLSSTPVTGGTYLVDVSEVVENVMPSVVSIVDTVEYKTNQYFNPYNYYFNGKNSSQTQEMPYSGSGVIIGEKNGDLLILTNAHVVNNDETTSSYTIKSKELTVTFCDGTSVDATVLGMDTDEDLAVIFVDLSKLTEETKNTIKIASVGNSDEVKVGSGVIAIGNALGYGQSVTTGIISAKNREVTIDNITRKLMQTDAAINPGNSGGALLNIRGEVIGINSNKIGGNAVEGMGFAIPISRAEPIIEHLMNKEVRDKVPEEEQGYLGINGVSVTAQVASAYNMPRGAFVAEIMENGGAADSELQKGDIITAVNGEKVKDMDELKEQLSYYRAGEEITLTVQRTSNNSYEEYEVKVTLGDRSVIEEYEKQHN